MEPRSSLLVVLVGAIASTTAACAPVTDSGSVETDESVASHEEALTACGAAKYDEALTHYKNAVAWSKDRLAQGVCRSENGFLWGIADEASRAVMTCDQFRGVIRTSPYAPPLREVLAPSLTLRSLTGELLVIKDSKFQNWTGVESYFQSGLTFWARAEGAYGSRVRVDFRANGKATWSYLEEDPVTGEITLQHVAASYTVTKSGGEASRRTVRVKHARTLETFSLGVNDSAEYKAAPLFTLEPVAPTKASAPALYSLVSECDA